MYYSPDKRLHYRLGGHKTPEVSSSAGSIPVILCALSALFALVAALTGIAKK